MDKKTRNKVNMFRATDKILTDNISTLQDLPDFSEIKDKFLGNMSEINALDSKLQNDTTGTTEEKEDLGELLANKAMNTSLMLKAHARKLKDKVLLNSISCTKSQLHYVADQTLLSRAGHILETAKLHEAGAATYGLTPDDISGLEASIAAFGESLATPREATINKKDLGAQLKALVRETDNLLKEDLDVLMDVKGNTDPELLSKYTSAREIIDR